MGERKRKAKKRTKKKSTNRTQSETEPQHIRIDDISHISNAILSRGIDLDLYGHFNSTEALRNHFILIYASILKEYARICKHLMWCLAKGNPDINKISVDLSKTVDPTSPYYSEWSEVPLLFIVCQWKRLAKIVNWRGGDELVDMAIRAGANVNYCSRLGRNALFYAVRYGSLRTVDLLIRANINISQRDSFGRTCLYHAMEYPSPPIIRRLLKYFPSNEIFELTYYPLRSPPVPVSATLPDMVVALIVGLCDSETSWEDMETLTACDVSEVLMLLRQKGTHFSSSSALPLKTLLASLAKNKVVDDLANSLVGATIPPSFTRAQKISNIDGNDVDNSLDNDQESISTLWFCSICRKLTKKAVILHCNHSFCRECIIDYGKTDEGDACPVCRRQLCLELRRSTATADNQFALENIVGYGGPGLMTDGQIEEECKFQGIQSCRQKLIDDQSFQDDFGIPIDLATELDCANGITLDDGRPIDLDGAVAIDVIISEVPLLARISNLSVYTVVSKTLVENLGLKRIHSLTSKNFDHTFGEQTTFTCLEPFCLRIGKVEVTLCTAMEASPDPISSMFGIQLGLDFLRSGVWCQMDVMTIGGLYIRVDGDAAVRLDNPPGQEMLRYYSNDGRSVKVPILRFSPFDATVSPGISLRDNAKFDQCYWCSRVFPTEMEVWCPSCSDAGIRVVYCDEKCQRLASEVHKKTCHKNDPE